MKVKYVKEGFGHPIGTVIDVNASISNTLIKRGICEVVKVSVATDTLDEEAAALAKVQAAEEAKAKAIEYIKATDLATVDYPALKQLAADLGLETVDQKKATLLDALGVFIASL